MASPRVPWTDSEDARLLTAVKRYGKHRWMAVAELVRTRDNKACRNRYLNVLDPSLDTRPFSTKDDLLLLACVHCQGKRWSTMAPYFPRRSPGSLNNRWRRLDQHMRALSDTLARVHTGVMNFDAL